MLWIVLIFIFAIYLFHLMHFKPDKKPGVRIWFGVPGSGKTTFAAWIAKKDLKKDHKVWSNVPIAGCYDLDFKNDVGKYDIRDGRVLCDEAGIEVNGRDWKNFSARLRYVIKYVRHYNLRMDFFSQGWSDCDKTIRDVALCYYIVRPWILPWFVERKTIAKKIDIDEVTHQPMDMYYWKPLSKRVIFAPSVWHMFNTVECEELEHKEWKTY